MRPALKVLMPLEAEEAALRLRVLPELGIKELLQAVRPNSSDTAPAGDYTYSGLRCGHLGDLVLRVDSGIGKLKSGEVTGTV